MAKSEVLLLTPIENLGNEGEQVEVKSGYARNFLLPKRMAVPVTNANKRQVEALRIRREQRLAHELNVAQEIAERLTTTSVAFAVKTGPGGKAFGSVTAQNIIDRLAEEHIELDRKQVQLAAPVKEVGRHSVTVKLHTDVVVEWEFDVVSENPIEEGADAEAATANA